MKELIEKYDELYDDMATAKDPKKMMVFGEAEKRMFHSLVERHPEIAEKWLTMLEAGNWNNYLTEEEAREITSHLINQDGTRGPHWDYDTFKRAVESIGGRMTDEPNYNCWALWAVANMRYSDNFRSASKFVPRDSMPRFFYEVAVETLTDVDRPHFVREYFKV